uniref:Uncharacterized protein n=2 Tax=Rhizophagus irregularis TaxID=588596 RepID=U9U3H2_RHIID
MAEEYVEKLIKFINPDEAVALYGAALQAAILLENTTEKIKDILLHDVNAFNIVTSGDVITPFIEYNTIIPIKKPKIFKLQSNSSH